MIDDDPSIRSFLKRALSYEGFSVDTAEDGEDGLQKAREKYPHLVIVDWMMPKMDGIEVVKRLREADPLLPVIMLTAKDANQDQVFGFGTGTDDYIVKPVVVELLIARIQSLLRRHSAEHPSLFRLADLELNPESFEVRRGDREITLTTVEFRLLEYFMNNLERVMDKQFLLDKVWGTDFYGDVNVVEVYVKQLRQKLEANGEVRLIHTIRGAGYVVREKP